MNTKKDKAKQSKIKPNTKKALDYFKEKNPNIQYLIDVFDLQIQTSKN